MWTRAVCAVAVAVVTLAAASVAPASVPPAGGGPAPVPCKSIGSGKYDCTFWPAGDGIHGGAPVLNSAGTRVGYLNQGTNWIICEHTGRTLTNGSTQNNWWAYTEANDLRWGWVNAIYAHGGANFGDFQGVPVCSNRGNPPGASGTSPAPTPTPPSSPSAPAPAQVPCTSVGGGKYDCSFWPAGDGIHGGAPVLSAAGARVGFLNLGTNWVVCQQAGREQIHGAYHNKWWAFTKANDGRSGWVSAVWASGGANDGSFANVPACAGGHGATPGAAGAQPSPAPRRQPVVRSNRCVGPSREDQRVSVRYRFLEIHQTDYTSTGTPGTPPIITNRKPPAYIDFAKIKVEASTCPTANGWRPQNPILIEPHSVGLRDNDPGLPIGKGSTKGWGVTINSYRNGALTVGAIACVKKTGHLWAGLKALVSFPVPKASYWISALQWAAGLAPVSDRTKVKCGDLGRDRLLIGADRHGRLRVTEQVPTPGDATAMSGISSGLTPVYSRGDQTYYWLDERVIQPPVITPGNA